MLTENELEAIDELDCECSPHRLVDAIARLLEDRFQLIQALETAQADVLEYSSTLDEIGDGVYRCRKRVSK